MGSRPRRDRWEDVNAMSERSSFGRNRGYRAVPMFRRRNSRIMRRVTSGYVLKGRNVSRRRELKIAYGQLRLNVPDWMRLTICEINSLGKR